MKIAVLGAGAMGILFGGYLSRHNEVLLVDVSQPLVDQINANGVEIREPDGSTLRVRPRATADTTGAEPMDLVIVFVKAMFSRGALETNHRLIGPNTYLMTLQNGSGHEDTLLGFVDRAHIIIGTTQHNSAVAGSGIALHGGAGKTCIGCLEGDPGRLQHIADTFIACGLDTSCCANIQQLVWDKLFTNVSASVLTAILQVPLGFIASDPYAWAMCKQLIREAVAVAGANGISFDAEEKISEVRAVCENSPDGITSICADLQKGRKSEVDTISGSVVRASRSSGVPAPSHELIVQIIHAMESKATDLSLQNTDIPPEKKRQIPNHCPAKAHVLSQHH